jgi:uncharacterized protein DUF3482/50S ribosome-binding GTPase
MTDAATTGTTVNLTLVSHTNVGKTTLMRTLLRRDVGEVADRAHVTEVAESHVLLDTPEGDVLRLWDTPGFGDSARLLRRLRNSGNPLGWLQTQWDRFTDRPFFCTQQALRNVRDESDVVLYLVNAAEDPRSAGYAAAELEILRWIGKPVLLLLNQTGQSRGAAADAADEAAWSGSLAEYVQSRGAVTLDAFARCWVQEDRLLGEASRLLPPAKQPAFERLRAAWRKRNLDVFRDSMKAIAVQLAAAITDREPVAEASLGAKAREFFASLRSDRSAEPDPATQGAMQRLAARLDQGVRESTDRLIALHGLPGRAHQEILARVSSQFDVTRPVDPVRSGVLGGMVTGALGGLAADVAAAGMTFGAGAILGGLLGALGAGGAAQAYNLMTGEEEGKVRWSGGFMMQRTEGALLRYLAVAHYGRGRGDWTVGEYPAHWRPLVERILANHRERLEALLLSAGDDGAQGLAGQIEAVIGMAAREILESLYPDARTIFRKPGSDPGFPTQGG